MKLIALVMLLLLSTPAWAGESTPYATLTEKTMKFQGVCRHTALYAASIAQEHYQVRIAVGPTSTPGIHHAQAQAFIGGQWQFIRVSNGKWGVCAQDDGFSPAPNATYTFAEFSDYLVKFADIERPLSSGATPFTPTLRSGATKFMRINGDMDRYPPPGPDGRIPISPRSGITPFDAASGDICKMLGHRWKVYKDVIRGGLSGSTAFQRIVDERKCSICGKTETKEEVWR